MERAKRGFLSDEKDVLELRQVINTCVVCFKQTTLMVHWDREKPAKLAGVRSKFKNMHYKPVKFMGAERAQLSRITVLVKEAGPSTSCNRG